MFHHMHEIDERIVAKSVPEPVIADANLTSSDSSVAKEAEHYPTHRIKQFTIPMRIII